MRQEYNLRVLALTNGRVYTGGPDQAPGRSLLMDRGRVAAVSPEPDPPWDAPRVDLQGRTVLPGWRDAHVHLLQCAEQRHQIAFRGDEDVPGIAAQVRARAAAAPAGSWIVGRGWDHNEWGGRRPNRADLDAAAPRHPVLLVRKDGHMCWASSLALQAAGIDARTDDPPGGQIERDATGCPNGLLLETAQRLVQQVIPPVEDAALAGLLEEALGAAAAAGLCAVANIGTAREFGALQQLDQEGRLPIRVAHVLYDEALPALLTLGLRSGFGGPRLRLAGIKIFVDGSLGSRTAWVFEPYARASGTGLVRTPPAVLRDLIRRANGGGLAAIVHAIGDQAVRAALDAFEAAQDLRGELARTPGHNRIEHLQLVDGQDFTRFRELDVLASMQPRHATADALVAEREWGERCTGAYPWAALQRVGATLAFGSDAPVEALAPLEGIYAAVTRQRPEGGPPWRPEQCLSLVDALRAYTVGAAAAGADPDATGLLRPGDPADCVVVDRDPFTVAPRDLLHLRVEATCVAGDWAYRAGAWGGNGPPPVISSGPGIPRGLAL